MKNEEELLKLVRNIEIAVRCRCRQMGRQRDDVPLTDDRLLNKPEAMDYLRITKSTYYRWIDRGILEPRGEEGQDRFYESDLRQIMARKRYRDRL